MSHIVVVETNRSGLALLEEALSRGLSVTFIYSRRFVMLWRSPRAVALLDQIQRVIELDDELEVDSLVAAFKKAKDAAPIDALITTAAWAIEPTAHAAKKMGLRFTSADAVSTSCDKAATRRVLERAGLPSVGFGEANDVDDALEVATRIGYPVVLKPVNGFGSISIAIAENENDINSYFVNLQDSAAPDDNYGVYNLRQSILVEEKLEGEFCSVELCRTAGGKSIPLMLAHRKRADHDETLELGSTVPPILETYRCDEIIAYADAVTHALGLNIGVFHIEIMMTANGPKLIEMNPRIMGGSLPELFRNATGDNAMAILLDIHLGLEPSSDRFVFRKAVTSRAIAPRTSGRIDVDLPSDWLADLTPSMDSWEISVEAGQEVKPVVHNFNALGFFQISGDDSRDSVDQAEKMLDIIEARLSIELTK